MRIIICGCHVLPNCKAFAIKEDAVTDIVVLLRYGTVATLNVKITLNVKLFTLRVIF